MSRLVAAVEGSELERVRAMVRQRPDLVRMDTPEQSEQRGLHYAAVRRDLRG